MGKKQYRVIDASMGIDEALELIQQNNMTAEYYQVPQGDDLKLAEAMRLLSGLGYVLKHQSSGLVVGRFIDGDVNYDRDCMRLNQSRCDSSRGIGSTVVPVDFSLGQRVVFKLGDAIA